MARIVLGLILCFSCSKEPGYVPAPIPDLSEDLNKLESRMIYSEALVIFWNLMKERSEQLFLVACEEASDPLPPLWAKVQQ